MTASEFVMGVIIATLARVSPWLVGIVFAIFGAGVLVGIAL